MFVRLPFVRSIVRSFVRQFAVMEVREAYESLRKLGAVLTKARQNKSKKNGKGGGQGGKAHFPAYFGQLQYAEMKTDNPVPAR